MTTLGVTQANTPGTDLEVQEVVEETADARSFILSVPADRREQFRYRAGQFLTIRVPLPGGPVARCYSLASAPRTDPQLKITVKRTVGGAASGWLVDNGVPGLLLRSLRPAGTFTLRDRPGDVVLFAAGSGITPVIAIAKEALAAADRRVRLFYANRDAESTIFRDELLRLEDLHGGRFGLDLWFEGDHAGVPGVDDVASFVEQCADGQHLLCGPSPFMDVVFQGLGKAGVPANAIHSERYETTSAYPFAPPAVPGSGAEPIGDANVSQVEVTLDGRTTRHDWPRNRVLIDVLLDAGIDAPYSCREGNCSACACVVLNGAVEMRNNMVLDDADIADGLVLGCQAVPLDDEVRVSFDA